jgi:uncharacterized integral membrane protein (TIGR00698 family)
MPTQVADVVGWVRRMAPGLLLALAVAAGAGIVALGLPATIGPVLLAVVGGLVIGNAVRLPPVTAPGLGLASKRILRLGVVLLGARLTLGDVVGIGVPAIGVVVLCLLIAGAVVALAARITGIPPRLAVLIGVGTAICGNSAIMATAPAIDAEQREISFAVATITVFGTLALLTFPLIGHLTGMSDAVFGFWAGLAINDTSQVVAGGAAYSSQALDVATVVKLVRNTFIAPVVLLAGVWAARRHVHAGGATRGSVRSAFPVFVLGFLALAVLRSVGLIGDELAEVLGVVATTAITIAIAAVGLSTRLQDLRSIGIRPFAVGMTAAVALAAVALGFATLLG